MPVIDFKWGLGVRNNHPHFFSWFKSHIESLRDHRTAIRSGQIWFALPDGSYILLVGKKHPGDRKDQAEKHCLGISEDGDWKPVPDEWVAAPCAMEIHFVDGNPPYFDAQHKRPGLVLCSPHSEGNATSLLSFGRALWARFENRGRGRHGRIDILAADTGSSRVGGAVPLWTAWGISADSGEDLLRYVDELRSSSPSRPLGRATRLMAELVGIHPWNGEERPLRAASKPIPIRGEIVLVRLEVGPTPIPCLVVSPDEFNRSYDDLVVLRCIPFRSHHGTATTTVVPLPESFEWNDQRWSVDLTLVRGMAFAERYVDSCQPERYYLDDATTVGNIAAGLRDLYA